MASEKRQCSKSPGWGTNRAAGYGDLAAGEEAVTTDRCEVYSMIANDDFACANVHRALDRVQSALFRS
jgi:hypothetical protein